MKRADVVVVGSGSLATKAVYALSQDRKFGLRVVIIARSGKKATQLAQIANARAGILSTASKFEALEIAEFTAAGFSRAFRGLKPKVIFQTASLQSPWEAAVGPNGWTKLVAAAGFGITLPLQMALTAEVSRAAGDSKAAIINGCYPDCVNVALERAGLRVTCGIGNAGIVEAFCRPHEKVKGGEVRVVGHHGQLRGWLLGNGEAVQPRIWVKKREVKAIRLSPKLESISEELNEVTAATALAVILTLVTGEELRMSIPGVAGLPGGYPYLVKRGNFILRLPAGISREEAMAHNRIGEQMDGLELGEGVRFGKKARAALAAAGFPYAEGFAFEEWSEAQAATLSLQNQLRLQK